MNAGRTPADRFAEVLLDLFQHLPDPRILEDAGHAPECRSCPLCRGVVALREHAPDVLDQVARVASALAAGLRDHAGDDVAQPRPDRAPDAEPPWWGRPPGRGDLPRTERIDITD